MDYIPRKRTALTTEKKGYKKVSQVKTSEGWLPPVKSTPLIVSEERAFRVRVKVKEDLRTLHEFQFKIVRDDGTVIDHTLLKLITLWQRNIDSESARDYIGSVHGYHPDEDPDDKQYWTYEDADEKGINGTWFYRKQEWNHEWKFNYDTRTQIWTVPFFRRKFPKVRRHKIFWVWFAVDDSVPVMYRRPSEPGGEPRYIYKRDDWYQEEDKLLPKFYTVRVPYYNKVMYRTPRCGGGGDMRTWGHNGIYTMTVTSSIAYTLKFNVPSIFNMYPYGHYWGIWLDTCAFSPPDCPACQADADEKGERWCSTDPYPIAIDESPNVMAVCSNGAQSSNLKTNPIIESTQIITPEPYKVQTEVHSIILSYHGSGLYTIVRHCGGDSPIEFPLQFRCYSLDVHIDADPNT